MRIRCTFRRKPTAFYLHPFLGGEVLPACEETSESAFVISLPYNIIMITAIEHSLSFDREPLLVVVTFANITENGCYY